MQRVDRPEPEQLVPYLKERIYVTFIGLAVLLALNLHPEETSAGAVAGSLTIAAVGAGLAVFGALVLFGLLAIGVQLLAHG